MGDEERCTGSRTPNCDRLEARRSDETCASFAERWIREWPRPEASTRQLYGTGCPSLRCGFRRQRHWERFRAALGSDVGARRATQPLEDHRDDVRGRPQHRPGRDRTRSPICASRSLEKTEEIHPPSLEEYRLLLDACTTLGGYGGEFRAMIQFAAWTGIRAGELHAVQWDDVEGEYLWVRRSRKTDGSIGKPKNGQERKIVLLPVARVLDQVPRRADPFIFHTAQGEPLQKGQPSLRVARRQSRLRDQA